MRELILYIQRLSYVKRIDFHDLTFEQKKKYIDYKIELNRFTYDDYLKALNQIEE